MITTLLALVAGATGATGAAATTSPVVRTTEGPVRGTSAGGHLVFRGIPYAAPPVAARRWAPPSPPAAWRDARDASRPAMACPQTDHGWNHQDYVFQSEDCLTLDVGTTTTAGKRPVLVWIHGGGNYAGSPGDMVTSPIVDKGVVLVAIRYRLGALGFLMRRGSGTGGGNLALQDQIAALRWVRENAARFGGDPDTVTIAGESAGGQDVGLLLAAPAARGLFRRAILGSGTPGFGLPWRDREEAMRMGDQFDAALDAGTDPERLRTASATAVVVAGEQLHDPVLTDDSYRWLRTTPGDAVLPETPDRLLAVAPTRDILIGTNAFELDLPGGRTRRDPFVATAYGANEAAARAYYRLDRPDPPADPRRGTRDQQIATDATFRCPAQRMARLLSGRGGRVWRYVFDGSAGGGMTKHAAELPYLYGGRRLGAVDLMDYWANFVKTGDPNADGLPAWPHYDAAGRHVTLDAAGVHVAAEAPDDICARGNHL